MMVLEWLKAARWSPYVVGAGIGVLSWLTFLISRKALGCSTSFARTAGMIERALRGKQVESKLYYRKYRPVIDWQWMLVLGMVIGSLASSLLSGSFDLQWVPSRWATAFGSAVMPRLIVALLGGVLIGFGSRWAGGCTSGHGISGTMQLAVSSWIASVSFFIGGIVTAYLLFGLIA
ncbi:MAG: YeeE/YedE thiosulfate transporter family protein [Anaerolineae bacterium]